jgi:hypothetical protein
MHPDFIGINDYLTFGAVVAALCVAVLIVGYFQERKRGKLPRR